MLTGNSYDFLSSSDRKFLEKVYAYAQEKNIDLAQVDNLLLIWLHIECCMLQMALA